MEVNLNGAVQSDAAALSRHMINNHFGSIINISSMWGVVGSSCEVAYSTAKSGLIGMTKALAKELGPSNIRVNCIAPGVIDTDMNAGLDENTVRELISETPVMRIGKPRDVGELAYFLSGSGAEFITGQVIGCQRRVCGLGGTEMEYIKTIFSERILKAVISNPKHKDGKYKKIEIELKKIGGTEKYQIACYTEKQVFHENVEPD